MRMRIDEWMGCAYHLCTRHAAVVMHAVYENVLWNYMHMLCNRAHCETSLTCQGGLCQAVGWRCGCLFFCVDSTTFDLDISRLLFIESIQSDRHHSYRKCELSMHLYFAIKYDDCHLFSNYVDLSACCSDDKAAALSSGPRNTQQPSHVIFFNRQATSEYHTSQIQIRKLHYSLSASKRLDKAARWIA